MSDEMLGSRAVAATRMHICMRIVRMCAHMRVNASPDQMSFFCAPNIIRLWHPVLQIRMEYLTTST